MTSSRLQASLTDKLIYEQTIKEYINDSVRQIMLRESKGTDSMHDLINLVKSAYHKLDSQFYLMSDDEVANIIRLADASYESAAKSLKSAKTRIEREHALKLFLVWALQMMTIINRNSKQHIHFHNQAASSICNRLADYTYMRLKPLLNYVSDLTISQHDTAFKYCVDCIKERLAATCELLGFFHLSNGKLEQAIAYLSEGINLYRETGYDNLNEICNIYILFAKGLCKINDLKMAEFYLKKLRTLLANEAFLNEDQRGAIAVNNLIQSYFDVITLFINKIITQPADGSFSDKLNMIQSVLRDKDLKSYTLKILLDQIMLMDFDNASLSALRLISFIKPNSHTPLRTVKGITNLSKLNVNDRQADDKISGDDKLPNVSNDDKLPNDKKIPAEITSAQPKVITEKMEAPIADNIKPVSSTVPNINKLEVDDEEVQQSDSKIKVKTHGTPYKNNWSKEEITENNVMYGPLSQAETLGFNQSFASEIIYPITSNEFPDGRYYGYYSRENTHPKQVSETTHAQAINTLVSGRVGYKSPSIKLVKNRNNTHSDKVAFKLAPLCNFRMFGRKVDEVRDAHGNVIKTLIAFDIPANHTSQKKMY